MKIYNIYFGNVHTEEEFYQAIIHAMDFPDWCGKNPNAIWDMMYMDVEYPAHIFLHDTDKLPSFPKEDYAILLRIFEKARTTYKVELKVTCL